MASDELAALIGAARAGRRTIIAGVPRAGKTTFAALLSSREGVPVRHTDDLIGALDWGAGSREVAKWFSEPGPWIVEGVACTRALRKWLAAHPTGRPADRVYWAARPTVALTSGQRVMAKGCETVWREIAPALEARGVDIRPVRVEARRGLFQGHESRPEAAPVTEADASMRRPR